MNSIRVALAAIAVTVLGGACLYGDAASDEVSGLYRDIGKELITIRKDNPGLQTTVYSLLDQIGRLYRAANTALQEKERAVQIAHEDRGATFVLRSENERLKTDLARMQGDLHTKTVEVAQAKQQMTILGREQEELRRAASEGEAKRTEFESRVKALQEFKPEAQATVPTNAAPKHAALEGDRPQEALREYTGEIEPSQAQVASAGRNEDYTKGTYEALS